jgi:hypothetical protein
VSALIRAIALVTALTSAGASASPAEPAPAAEPDAAVHDASWVEPGRAPAPEVAPEPGPSVIQVDAKNYRLVVAGNILTGVGLGAFIAMTTGFLVASDARDRLGFANARHDEAEIAKQERRERTGNIVGISGAAAAGALLISGLTLIGVGRTRERKRRAALEASRLTPVVGPGIVGVQWVARF